MHDLEAYGWSLASSCKLQPVGAHVESIAFHTENALQS